MAQSKDFYNKAINDPDSLAEFGRFEEPLECEGFSDVALDAYEELTGEELSMDGLMPEPANPYGEDWEDEDLPRLLPRLTALYNF